jgi:hypothetical protein
MPTQGRYKNQKFSHDFANADAGKVIHFPDGRVCAVKRKVTQETPEQTTARIEREETIIKENRKPKHEVSKSTWPVIFLSVISRALGRRAISIF